jgi:hypothetical protein
MRVESQPISRSWTRCEVNVRASVKVTGLFNQKEARVKLKFSDGVEIDTAGPYRMIREHDGLYVVGRGMCVPVEDEKEAREVIDELKGGNKVQTK